MIKVNSGVQVNESPFISCIYVYYFSALYTICKEKILCELYQSLAWCNRWKSNELNILQIYDGLRQELEIIKISEAVKLDFGSRIVANKYQVKSNTIGNS